MGFNTRQANKLVIESFLKEGSNPWFRPSFRVFTDNSIVPRNNFLEILRPIEQSHTTTNGVYFEFMILIVKAPLKVVLIIKLEVGHSCPAQTTINIVSSVV